LKKNYLQIGHGFLMIKVKKRKILLLPGDGIGPEVVSEVKKIINWLNSKRSLDFEIDEDLVGGAAYDKHGTPITDEVFYKALESEAVILGAVGGPKWDNLDFSKKPERALLKLRKELKLFANLRPAICFKQLVDASSLKPEIVSGLDIMIVRELTGGIYFGEPRGIKPIDNGERKGVNTHTYTSSEIARVARVAFDLAKKRNNKVTSCEKSNVMEAGQLWREEVTETHKNEFKEVKLEHMLADNCAMQLLRNPKQFDVIVTDNLFGDILSDEAAMLTGSLGLLPSASLGAKDKNGNIRSMYEPVHGSAPDIAGKNLANPIATILSFSMALKYSLNLEKEAKEIDTAVQSVLDMGLRTKDIYSKGNKEVSTTAMGDAIIAQLQK
jgi:3-isopropylmalate dehydrogenase